jgi:hypothetical protein
VDWLSEASALSQSCLARAPNFRLLREHQSARECGEYAASGLQALASFSQRGHAEFCDIHAYAQLKPAIT